MKFQGIATKVLGVRDYYQPEPQLTVCHYAHLKDMHLAKMGCPASCGSKCPNHFCNAHNGQEYIP